MTVTTTARLVIAIGNGATTEWPFGFEVPLATDLVVETRVVATSVTTVIASSQYSVVGIGLVAGGTVTYPLSGSPLASTVEIIISRVVPFTQLLSIKNQDGFNPEVVEDAFDDVVFQTQQLAEDLGRTFKVPSGETMNVSLPKISSRLSKYFFFDANGNPGVTGDAPATTTQNFDTRTALAAATVDGAINLVVTGGYSTFGDFGGALYKRVGAEPSHALKAQSADGAWWEIVPNNNIVPFQATGGIEGDSASNGAANITAFNAFIGYAQDKFQDSVNADGPTLQFPKGNYHFNDHLNVKAAVIIQGAGGWGEGVRTATVLHFVANSNGIIVQAHDTIDETTEAETFTGLGSVIEGLHLIGNGFGDTTGHGIWLRASAEVRNCFVTQFGLDGFHIVANVGSGGATEGNTNQWRLHGCLSKRNGRHGYYIDDADANAGAAYTCDATLNARWGFFDSSLLGNTYIACHSSANGGLGTAGNDSDEGSLVTFGGNRYSANVAASEADLVATEPGTDQTVWILEGSGGTGQFVPLWVVAKPEGTYFHGGPYHTDAVGASSIFLGCYRENNQAVNQVRAPSAIIQGEMSSNEGSGYFQKSTPSGSEITGQVTYDNTGTFFETSLRAILGLNINRQAEKLLRMEIDTADFIGVVGWDETDDVMLIGEYNNSASLRPIRITSATTTLDGGRDSTLGGGELILGMGVFIGDSRSNARHVTNGTALPTSGDKAKGEVVLNRNAGSGDPWGWWCTTGHASTPTFTTVYGIGTQQSNIVDASTSHALNATFSDTEVEAALDTLGTKINSLIAALEHFGFTAA